MEVAVGQRWVGNFRGGEKWSDSKNIWEVELTELGLSTGDSKKTSNTCLSNGISLMGKTCCQEIQYLV